MSQPPTDEELARWDALMTEAEFHGVGEIQKGIRRRLVAEVRRLRRQLDAERATPSKPRERALRAALEALIAAAAEAVDSYGDATMDRNVMAIARDVLEDLGPKEDGEDPGCRPARRWLDARAKP